MLKQLKIRTQNLRENKLFDEIGTYTIFPLFLCIIILSLFLIRSYITAEIQIYRLADISSLIPIQPYPMVKTSFYPEVSALSAIILDDTSKVVLYEKNSHIRFSMASTVKIMTALTALDYFKPDDMLLIKTATAEGTVVGLSKDSSFYFDDLLYAMLLPSGNDAALAIATNYPGGVDTFVKKMNEKAKVLSLHNTHYGDPAGLLDDQDYATAFDLARLASIAANNPTIARITGTKNKIITSTDEVHTYSLQNLNKLLGMNGVNGIKTGLTEGAGGVLVTSTVQNGHLFLIVVMKSEDRFYDTGVLLSYLTDNITYFVPKN